MGIYCFTLKTVIIDMMLLLFTEFKNNKKKQHYIIDVITPYFYQSYL